MHSARVRRRRSHLHTPASLVSISERLCTSWPLPPPHFYRHRVGARLSTQLATQQCSICFLGLLPSPFVKQGVQQPPNYIINTGAVRGAGTDANLNPQPLQPHHHPAIFLMLLVLLCSCRMGLATAAEAPCLEVSKRCLTADDRAPCRGARCKLPTGIY